MINTIHIKNIGIIDDVTVNLNEGFNVLTGETGAGKTLIIDSIQILSGGRFSKEIIRHGEKNSFVEMSIYLPEQGFEDDTVIVSREVNINGKNICKINGRLITVSELKLFMQKIIDIHGQNDNQSVLDVSTHIGLVDGFANRKIEALKDEYLVSYKMYENILTELKKNYGDDKERERKLDLLKYQINEIESANLKVGEEEELIEKHKLIMSSEKIALNLKSGLEALNSNSIDGLSSAIHALEKIESFSEKYSKMLESLKSCYYEMEEASRDIEESLENISFDEEEQNSVEERLNLLQELKRKYGNNILEIITYKDKIKQEVYEIENLDGYIMLLNKRKKEVEVKLLSLAKKMHDVRVEYANILSGNVNKELQDLEMKSAKFNVKVEFNENGKFNSNGLDNVEFVIKTNAGEDEKSLVKIASGGEMSRIMLAIKSVLADVDKVPVLIFDEIDTGISGVAANATGEKMKNISKNHQVICVTHLASIAAKGDYNYFISKEEKDNKTYTRVSELNEEETLKEIARIASGKVTDVTIKHAMELRCMCN